MCRPSGALGWLGHGLSTASPRRPTEAACILYAFFGKASQCPGRGVAHFCARPRPAVSGIPYAGMPDLVVGPAKSDLRLKNGAPGRARTSCLRFRKPPLCPDELRELVSPEDAGARPCALRHGCIRALRARSSHRRALTRPGCGGLRRRTFVKHPLAGSCPGRVSAALGCVHLSANPQAV